MTAFRAADRPILLLALTVVSCALVWTLFVENFVAYDEITLLNPVATYLQSGRMTYPAHGYFDEMIVHPPTHYFVVALAMKAGIPLMYAVGLPVLLLTVIAVALIVRSRFSRTVQVALLFGFFAGLFFPWYLIHRPTFGPSLRPEAHLALAWFAGLVALETGRLANWSLGRLFAGAALLTYASGLHYPAITAWTGVLVYLAWALRVRGWPESKGPVLALLGGGAAVVVPFLALFWIPHELDIVSMIRSTAPLGGLRESLAAHGVLYQRVWQAGRDHLLTAVLFSPLQMGVPTLLLSTTTLLARRETRGLALASLPHPLFVLLAVQRKTAAVTYLLPEFMLFVSAVTLLALLAAGAVHDRVTGRERERVTRVGAVALAALLLVGTPWLARAMYSSQPKIDGMQVARAAGRLMLGPDALVGHRLGRFYTSGAAHSYLIQNDLLGKGRRRFALSEYASLFDALAEDPHMSEATNNDERMSLASWYAGGQLRLRGFYISARQPALSYMLLASAPGAPLQGYGMLASGEVMGFRQSPDGDHLFLAVVCDAGVAPAVPGRVVLGSSYALPAPIDARPGQVLNLLVVTRSGAEPPGDTSGAGCAVRDRVPVRREALGVGQLLATLRDDKPIRFYPDPQTAWRSRHGELAELELADEGWPAQIRFIRGPSAGTSFSLSGRGACVALRQDIEDPATWTLTKAWKGGHLEQALESRPAARPTLRFVPGGRHDQIASSWSAPVCDGTDIVFFSILVKREPGVPPPDVTLRGPKEILLRETFVCERPDGWVLMAGWGPLTRPTRSRLVVTDSSRGRSLLLDKGFIVGLQGPPWEPRACSAPAGGQRDRTG